MKAVVVDTDAFTDEHRLPEAVGICLSGGRYYRSLFLGLTVSQHFFPLGDSSYLRIA